MPANSTQWHAIGSAATTPAATRRIREFLPFAISNENHGQGPPFEFVDLAVDESEAALAGAGCTRTLT